MTSNANATDCVVCPLAKFALLLGSPICKDCIITENEYTDGRGSTQCRRCSEGKFSTGSDCQTCIAGQYQVEPGVFKCELCEIGKYQDRDGLSECKDCDISKLEYTDEPGSSQCQSCDEGTFSTGIDCQTCVAGQYQVEPGVFKCELCEIGQYQDRDGLSECKNCSNGQFPNEKGQTTCTDEASGGTGESSVWVPVLIVASVIVLIGLCWYFRESMKESCAGATVKGVTSSGSGDVEMQSNPMPIRSPRPLISTAEINILRAIVLEKNAGNQIQPVVATRYVAGEMKTGHRTEATGSLANYMGIPDEDLFKKNRMKHSKHGYLKAIEREVMIDSN